MKTYIKVLGYTVFVNSVTFYNPINMLYFYIRYAKSVQSTFSRLHYLPI